MTGPAWWTTSTWSGTAEFLSWIKLRRGRAGCAAEKLQTLGTKSFSEPVIRHAAERAYNPHRKRSERSQFGVVKFQRQLLVPDVGGLGWRTKTGHLLKNQSYYPQTSMNSWDVPACAGVRTWQDMQERSFNSLIFELNSIEL